MRTCQRCGTGELIRYGYNRSGSQRRKCKACGAVVTWDTNPRGYDDHTKGLAIRMVLEGNSFAATGRVLDVNPQTVANWVQAHAARLPDPPAQPTGEVEQVEVDELFTFVGRKKRRPT